MRRWFAALLLAMGCASAPAPVPGPAPAPEPAAAPISAADSRPLPPSLVYPGLFQAVAMTDLYEPKDWVDARPLGTPDEIMAAWRAAGTPTDRAALAAFTDDWFDSPAEVAAPVDLAPGRTLGEHVDALWPVLTREQSGGAAGSLLPLPNAYVVPGGRFREVYYWDAYFTMTGMGPEHDALKRDMVDNFAEQIERYGRVPNANRSYYLSRSQPPFFHAMVGLLSPDDPAAAHAEYLDALIAEWSFWKGMGSPRMVPSGVTSLARYWDDRDAPRDESYRYDVATAAASGREPSTVYRELRAGAESGWDYSSRWFTGEDLDSIEVTTVLPVDLNAILYGLELAIRSGCERAPQAKCEVFGEEGPTVPATRALLQGLFWNEDAGAFADVRPSLSGDPMVGDRITAATLYPLFFGAATQGQADAVAKTVRAELLAPGGLVTTTVNSGEQWDAPNGWAPLQWLAVLGLERYGHDDLAFEIARRWTSTVARGFCESGKLVEKYDVMTAREGGGGEYPNQDGFGWTNGVTMALIRRDARLSGLSAVPEMTAAPEACGGAVKAALREGVGADADGAR